ncbi:hypothetical protein [Lacisediminimonas profundi]|uniref:hypothetical protein n=1 Tax=Lacisediminimonas profundi TaxID=2603856 RepID=UPI00124B14D6|nr:hypothetical protein [Lacisediminimonas profundi]
MDDTGKDKRIKDLEDQVQELRRNVEGMAHSIWTEAGAAKVCQTAVAVLLNALRANPFVAQALRESLDGADEQLRSMNWTPPVPYLDSFAQARQFILSEAGQPCLSEQGRPPGVTLQ